MLMTADPLAACNCSDSTGRGCLRRCHSAFPAVQTTVYMQLLLPATFIVTAVASVQQVEVMVVAPESADKQIPMNTVL